ncbi:AraC-type DNA-binding protein [Micromonospora phaseoli]|uniref:AraC-type DNA-binding protein n=1 Tax=Micromonospora phaseoli TaxID=1144548 RepID=A0A1H7CNK4_9ACTN|nr:AraC family transcriptional regulator [Micromonospora phaseoli]PZV91651.1 AraC family transcriptional regulator [Micromonospora phaseoli]SEJ91268.1 AraC-type DNA-binding protein [Micromonospora phaseoli]
MDPLDDVLRLLGTTSHVSASMTAGGSWAVGFDAPDGIKFNAVRRGRCYLRLDGSVEAIPLAAGDCYLLTHSRPYTLFSDPEAAAMPAGPIFLAATDGVARAGVGDEFAAIGGAFRFGERARELLLDGLPTVIHVPAATAEAAALQWAIDQIDVELRQRRVGATLVAEHLAVVMLIQILRHRLASEPAPTTGLLAGLGDPVVAVALREMHRQPAHGWQVAELARAASVSRSTLAARFKDLVGRGPLEYLTGWRVELAANRLRSGDETLASIAQHVGYGSESALSVAFKRVTGHTPRAYRHLARTR